MKFRHITLIILILHLSVSFCKKTLNNLWIKPHIKTAKSYVSFANLPYCNIDAIEALACPLCDMILDGSFKVIKAEKINEFGVDFKFVILVSEINQEVIITFSGPKSTDSEFYKKLWINGFNKFHEVNVEKAYVNVYHKLSDTLNSSLKNLFKSHPTIKDNYKFILIGHSFGGSLAVLSAYDLIQTNIIKQNLAISSPLVYSYGQLRIGDSDFVNKVNESFKVIRIIKDNDYMTRAPNCIPNKNNNWKCFEKEKDLVHQAPKIKQYIMHTKNRDNIPGYVLANESSDPRRSSFIEKANKKKKIVHYNTNYPGVGVNTWGYGLTNQGANQRNGIYYSQPIGAEVIYSTTFDTHKVCQYFNGIPNCEKDLPNEFNGNDHANYFGANIEKC